MSALTSGGCMNMYPSLMVVKKTDLKKEIELLQPYCAGFHIDVMDNTFVPNVTWNAQEVNELVKMIKTPWIHLMTEDPAVFYDQLFLPVNSIISFHIEVNSDVFDFVKTIKEKKHRASIAIRPKTPISDLIPFLDIVDHILVMSVEPGFSGQTFLPSTFERLDELIALRKKYNSDFKIGVDGGVNKKNITNVAARGVDDCAVATAIFESSDHVQTLQKLQKLVHI
jgi:ribulose-phosphate 3-epimerase